MALPVKVSEDEDTEVIDLQNEEVTIDLSNNNAPSPKDEAKGSKARAPASAPEPAAAPVGRAATAPPKAGRDGTGTGGTGEGPAKAPAGGKGKGLPGFLRTKNGKSLLVVVVAALIVGALMVVPMGNQSPEAVISVPKTDPTDGEAIRISANESSDPDGKIDVYDWTYPEDFIKFDERDGGGGDGRSWIWGYFCIKHTEGVQDRTITLTVKDETGAEDTDEIVLTIRPLIVTPAEERIGDRGDYDLNGKVTMSNPDGIFTIEKSNIVKVDDTVSLIYLEYSGTVAVRVNEVPDPVEDGFLQNHTVYERRTAFTLDLIDESYASTENNGNQPITGSIQGTTETFIYAPADRAIKMRMVVSNGRITAGDIFQEEKRISGTAVGYPHVQSEDNTLHVSDLEGDIDISSSDSITVGGVVIDWLAVDVKAVKVDDIGHVACLEIDLEVIEIDGEDVDDPPQITYWMADGLSLPVKTRFEHTKTNDDGTTTTTINTKRMTDYAGGTDALPTAESEFVTRLTDNWHRHDPDNWTAVGSYDKMGPLTDLNKQGRHDFHETNSHIYQVEDAYDDAWTQDAEFRAYMSDHPDAYNVLSLYNETGSEKVWNLTFGEGGSDEFYNIEVSNERGVTENGEGLIDEDVELGQGIDDVSPVYAFSTCVHRIYLLGEYDGFERVRDELFEDGTTDYEFEEASVGQGILAAYPMPLSGASGEVTNYTVFGLNLGRNLTVVTDAVTGQIMYYAEKRGFLDILDLQDLLSGA